MSLNSWTGALDSVRSPMTDPTDAEIIALADATRTGEPGRNGYVLPISFARAVLAKWGTPAGAGGDQVGRAMSLPGISGFTMACFHSDVVPLGTKLYTTPQPTKAQAGAVPLHASVVKRIWDECRSQGLDYVAFAWRIQRAATEAAHGIKGGQHGTDI